MSVFRSTDPFGGALIFDFCASASWKTFQKIVPKLVPTGFSQRKQSLHSL